MVIPKAKLKDLAAALFVLGVFAWTITSLNAQTAPGRNAKFGIFYFTWHCPARNPTLDISEVLAGRQQWGPVPAFHWWDEPVNGYYCLTTDENVLRDHAIKLRDAGIDFIFVDIAEWAYSDSRSDRPQELVLRPLERLLQVWSTIPNAPKVVPFFPLSVDSNIDQAVLPILERYPNMRFSYLGKPLILVNEGANGNRVNVLSQTYTVRQMWGLQQSGNAWSFLLRCAAGFKQSQGNQPCNQRVITLNGQPEQISVAAAYQETGMSDKRTAVPKFNGKTFIKQFQTVFNNPTVPIVTITSWNEWIAQRGCHDANGNPVGENSRCVVDSYPDGSKFFTDLYDIEYSKDIEPGKNEKGDFYYQLMKSCIAKFRNGENGCSITFTPPPPPPPTPTPTPTPQPPPPPPPPPPPSVSGTRPPDLVCVPLPEDPIKLAECNFWDIVDPILPPPLPPGTSPTNPATFSISGAFGIAAAYNPQNDTVLVTAHGTQNRDDGVFGILLDGQTLQQKSQVKIDQGPTNRFAGSPKVVFAEDLNKFLIAWEDERSGNGRRHIFGRFVNADGTPGASDFPILTSGDAFLRDLDYDVKNKKFVVTYEYNIRGQQARGAVIKTIDSSGTVGQETRINSGLTFQYEGQASLAVNSNLNEYWLILASCSSPDTSQEDCKIVLTRVNASTLSRVGQTQILSTPRIGRNAFGEPKIDYGSTSQAAMTVWLERGRDGEPGGIYGRTAYDDGSLSQEYPVITPHTEPSSEFFGSPVVNYNPYTETFFVSALDNSGGTMLVEMDVSGFVYETKQIIAPPSVSRSNFEKFIALFIKPVGAAAFGNFNPTITITKNGAVGCASRNYSNVSCVAYNSPNSSGQGSSPTTTPTTSPTTQPIDTTQLPKLIVRIYTWSLALAAILAVMMVTFGGYLYMMAGGNAEQATRGKDYIWQALAGLGILFLSYIILNTINPDLINFKNPFETLNVRR